MTDKVHQLFAGDTRCVSLLDGLQEVTYSLGAGMPLPTVLGTIDLLKQTLINEALDD